MKFFRKTLNSKAKNDCNYKSHYEWYPNYIDNQKSQYLIIDNIYISSLIVIDYSKEMEAIFLDKLLSLEIDLAMSMFYKKENTTEIIKKITYYIGNNKAELSSITDSQTDNELVFTTYNDAKYIRKEMQINGEDFYYIYIYLSVYANSDYELESSIQKIESVSNGIGLTVRRATFRELDILKATMPFAQIDKGTEKYVRRNVLTSGIISSYPFICNELCDENGILIGTNQINKSIVMIDRFNSYKYKNGNMFVIGTSGSGKSYFTKLMIARNRYIGIQQYVIDPEREYTKLCERLNGIIINFENENIINLMDIRESSLEDDNGYLQNKINKLNTFFSLILKDITSEELSLLEEKVIQAYYEKGITFDDNTLYEKINNGNLISYKKFKSTYDMPILGDVLKIIQKEKRLDRVATLLKPYISGSLKFLNGYTNINIKNKLIIADIYNIEEGSLPAVMFVITEMFWDRIKNSREIKKIIYMDEIWRLISCNSNTANFIFKIFKTIRKYGGAATAITQDINDFFSLENRKVW